MGGLELSIRDMLRICEQLAAIDITLASLVGINNVLGISPLLNFAQAPLREKWLPLLASGRVLASFALTEPGAGSDPRLLSTTAVPTTEGGWRLNGTKMWSGSASWAGIINVFAKVIDESGTVQGITAFAIEEDTPGLRQGPEALTMGVRAMVQNSIFLEDVHVGPTALLGKVGEGMAVAQEAMMFGRLGLAAISAGGMKRCAQLMVRYASRRTVSTGRLLENPVTLTRLNALTTRVSAIKSLINPMATWLDQGEQIPVEAYIACKTSGPEFLWRAADDLVQLLGGRGYIETNIAPQILRDARLLRIFEGPTETLNMFLGSKFLRDSEPLNHFLKTRLKAPEVADRLLTIAQQIEKEYSGPKAPFTHSVTTRQLIHVRIGEVATTAILLAAIQKASQEQSSDDLQRANKHFESYFNQQISEALSLKPEIHQQDCEREIQNYTVSIEDIEQPLHGEDSTLDPFLKQKDHPKPILDPSKSKATSSSPRSDSKVNVVSTEYTKTSIQEWITQWLIKELKLNGQRINPEQPFSSYGIDSVTAVSLSGDLQQWTGLSLDPNLVYDFPTMSALTKYLLQELQVTSVDPNETSPVYQERSSSIDELDAMVSELEQLSDLEAEDILKKKLADRGGD